MPHFCYKKLNIFRLIFLFFILSCNRWEYEDFSSPIDANPPETYLSLIAIDTIYAAMDSMGNMVYAIDDTTSLTYYYNGVDSTLSEYYYQNSVLYATSGNRLSYMPETSAYISLDKDYTLAGRSAYMNLDYSYTGDRYNSYENGAILLPSYGLANFRTGVDFNNTSLEFYINNLLDKDAYLSRYNDFEGVGFGIKRTSSKPRVVGIRFRYRY